MRYFFIYIIKYEKQDPDTINSFTPENMKILNLEKWRDMYFEKRIEEIESEFEIISNYFNEFSVINYLFNKF